MAESPADDPHLAKTTEPAEETETHLPSRRTFLAGIAVGAATVGVPAAVALQRSGNADMAAPAAAPGATPTPAATAGPQPAATATTTTTVGPAETPPAATPANPGEIRRAAALEVRQRAAELAAGIELPTHSANGDERADNGYAFSFTKGLPHDYETGLVFNPADFEQFVAAIETGTPQDFIDTPLGPINGYITAPDDSPMRAWESASIGNSFDLIGPDMQCLTMPPAPRAGSGELIGEMAEVYAQALLRDEVLSNLRYDGSTTLSQERVIAGLNDLEWFGENAEVTGLDANDLARRRTALTQQTAFRGIAPGDNVGPYVSQLLLVGSARGEDRAIADGFVQFGAQSIDQRVRRAAPVDFMASWDEWFDVQNALVPPGGQQFEGADRFITTGRDLATYVHTDALYQSYLNACLVLFSHGTALDPGMPFSQSDTVDHQQGFVLFAPNHVLSLLAEVCMRALKTVKFQKFNVHRRLRPEELAARIEKAELLQIPEVTAMADALQLSSIAGDVRLMTQAASGTPSMLLPMAYAEGSPMHPSYGAGHGVVAGACATIMKALFDHTEPITVAGTSAHAYVANPDGSALERVRVFDHDGGPGQLTVEGEVNKLAANIAIGRSWAGVHYFSDYWESIRLGEAIAIQILREHMLTTTVDFTLTVPTFEGDIITLTS